jgi:hypothetical protein
MLGSKVIWGDGLLAFGVGAVATIEMISGSRKKPFIAEERSSNYGGEVIDLRSKTYRTSQCWGDRGKTL